MTSESALPHIPEDTLEQYCMGRLSEPEKEPVEEHLLFCNTCQDALTETAEFLQAVRAATEKLASQSEPETWWKRWWNNAIALPKPVVAIAVCALALFVVIPRREGTPSVIQLQTLRGPETAPQAPANTPLTLRLALPETGAAGPFEIRLADSAGALVATAPVEFSAGTAVAKVKGLARGAYWARLYTSGQLVREYALNVP